MAKQPPTNKPKSGEHPKTEEQRVNVEIISDDNSDDNSDGDAAVIAEEKKKNKRKTASELRHASNVKTLSALGAKRLAEVLLSKSASAEALMDELGI